MYCQMEHLNDQYFFQSVLSRISADLFDVAGLRIGWPRRSSRGRSRSSACAAERARRAPRPGGSRPRARRRTPPGSEALERGEESSGRKQTTRRHPKLYATRRGTSRSNTKGLFRFNQAVLCQTLSTVSITSKRSSGGSGGVGPNLFTHLNKETSLYQYIYKTKYNSRTAELRGQLREA